MFAKKYITGLLLVTIPVFFSSSLFAQNRRSYTTSKFALQPDGPGKGFLQPVKQGDTLTYTINKLADSSLIRKKFDSTFGPTGKRYYLKYKKKNTPTIPGTKKPG